MSETGSKGVVYLVGAGPGDPGLLTVRGAQLLASAEVVVYDYLSNPALLGHAPNAEAIYVGKKAAHHSMTQEQINALLVEKGKLGKRVVRLKGGDPFIFGRGGEECEALRGAGIRFEVVPGITSAIGGPAYAGIPVTHRDFNSSFTVITGHEKEEEYKDNEAKARDLAKGSSDLDWASIAKLPCMAFYMGVKSLPRIVSKLIEHGMDPSTPSATIRWGTTPRQQVVTAPLIELPEAVTKAGIGAPAITIVGKVVSLRETMSWFENRPLFGQTIVVTRTRQQASELSGQLEELGAGVIEAPTIEIGAPTDWAPVDHALRRLEHYDWVVFTSASGVSATRDRLLHLGKDARAFGKSKIAAIGDATAKAVRDLLCINVDLCPARFVAEALAEAFEDDDEVAGRKFLMLRADIARPILRERLISGRAAEVADISVYETISVSGLPAHLLEALDAGRVDWVTFTSSSTARNFVSLLGEGFRERMQGVKIVSIGPITSETIRTLGLAPTVEAGVSDINGVVEAIVGASATGNA